MKHVSVWIWAAVILTAMLFSACKTLSTGVNYITGTEQTITARAEGVGRTEDKAVADAEQKVFETLFFRGLPESHQKTPLVGINENEEKAKHKTYFSRFYNEQRYKTFVMSAVAVSGAKTVKGGKALVVDVKINLSALRSDLEAGGVIRKFGY